MSYKEVRRDYISKEEIIEAVSEVLAIGHGDLAFEIFRLLGFKDVPILSRTLESDKK